MRILADKIKNTLIMSLRNQYDVNENWDVVLYYTRHICPPPIEPNFDDIKKSNPNLSINELLDIFSKHKSNYQKELLNYENNKIDGTSSSFVFFPLDYNFISNVKNFEKNSFFIDWNKSSKDIIKETIINLNK